MMVWYRFLPGWQILLLPAFVLLGFIASIGPALWLAALNVKYRDFRIIIPFVVQFGLYVSLPVGFTSAIVPAQWRLLYSFNPIVGVIDGFFAGALLARPEPIVSACGLAASATAAACFFLWFGIRRFRNTEKSFADLI